MTPHDYEFVRTYQAFTTPIGYSETSLIVDDDPYCPENSPRCVLWNQPFTNMPKKRKARFRGIAAPVYAREPLLVRLCTAFVDNLASILRVALVVGSILLVQDLRTLFEETAQPVAEVTPVPAVADDIEAIATTEAQDRVLNERVLHYLNCTYEDYRNAHYDACVKEPSRIYRKPEAGPDDTGQLIYGTQVLYARFDDYANLE